MTIKDFTKNIVHRQVHCSSCYSINYGKLTYSGQQFDIVQCSECGYPNEVH